MVNLTTEEFTPRQTMEQSFFECHHKLDKRPPKIDFHEHEFYEIFFFLSGDVSYIIEGRTYQLRPGDILLTNTRDIHKPDIRSGKPFERYVLWIEPEALDQIQILGADLAACILDAADQKYKRIRPDSHALTHLKGICEKMIRARYEGGFASDTLSYLYLCEFLVYLNRAYFVLPDTVWEDVIENDKINDVVAYINEYFAEDLNLDRLAGHFYVSKYYLSHQFKEYTGLTLYQFIIKKRLAVARNMLREGHSVSEAYLRCGFNDYSNFLKLFKREFERSPKEFMRHMG